MGDCQQAALLAWELGTVKHEKETFYVLGQKQSTLTWIVMMGPSADGSFMVIPSKAVSPARQFLACGKTFCPTTGVVLQKTGEPEFVLRAAAKGEFMRLTRPTLEKLALSRGLEKPCGTLYDLVLALVRSILEGLPDAELEGIMSLRAASRPSELPPGLTPEILQGVAGEAASKDLEEPVRQVVCG